MTDAPRPERPKCTATSKSSGVRCKRGPIPGGTVCSKHGGSAPQVKRAAARRLADLIDPDRALREGARVAYSNVRALFDDNGNLKPMKDWPEDAAAAVAGIEVVKRNVDSGDGKIDDVIKVKLWDKVRALEMLFKHLGLLVERLDHTGEIKISWEAGDEAADSKRLGLDE